MFGGTRPRQGPADEARRSSLDLRPCLSHPHAWGRASDHEGESNLRHSKRAEHDRLERLTEHAHATSTAGDERG
jgi:hypothetical protein